MRRIVSWARAFGQFWYGFIIGDDWTVAAAVLAALAGVWALRHAHVTAWWLLPVVVVASLGASIWRLERRSS